jgi:cellulase
LNDNCGKVPVTVPSELAAGNYLVRAEAIALHSAGSEGGAQFYMTCFQVNVASSGTVNPMGVSFPGAYSSTDPGILINIYDPANIADYQIPGPAVWTGAGTGTVSSSIPVSSSTASGAIVLSSGAPVSSVSNTVISAVVSSSVLVPTTLQTMIKSSIVVTTIPATQISVATATEDGTVTTTNQAATSISPQIIAPGDSGAVDCE